MFTGFMERTFVRDARFYMNPDAWEDARKDGITRKRK